MSTIVVRKLDVFNSWMPRIVGLVGRDLIYFLMIIFLILPPNLSTFQEEIMIRCFPSKKLEKSEEYTG